ncbi:alpha/beta hydrolase [Ectothiorhodospiraceae bacterium WFHF3C12]|nr:alpha/beta hydrolase [Ectothiorhodospiraceae bacterium WFHF3C12]
MKPSRSEYITIRGVRYHVRRWGPEDGQPLLMFHGWLDTSATFQFLVDELAREWSVIAPDWRGYGGSDWRDDKYWLYDDLADMDFFVDHYGGGQPVNLLGHSYGGGVAGLFAGARPDRVRRLVSLEGFGPQQRHLSEAPDRVAHFLDAVRERHSGSVYESREALARRLRKANPRLTEARARFLAGHVARDAENGGVELAADPWRRMITVALSFPTIEFFEQFWRRTTAPTLWVRGDDSFYMKYAFGDEEAAYHRRLACLPDGRDVLIRDAGHNLHHDHPGPVARSVEAFLTGEAPAARDRTGMAMDR